MPSNRFEGIIKDFELIPPDSVCISRYGLCILQKGEDKFILILHRDDSGVVELNKCLESMFNHLKKHHSVILHDKWGITDIYADEIITKQEFTYLVIYLEGGTQTKLTTIVSILLHLFETKVDSFKDSDELDRMITKYSD